MQRQEVEEILGKASQYRGLCPNDIQTVAAFGLSGCLPLSFLGNTADTVDVGRLAKCRWDGDRQISLRIVVAALFEKGPAAADFSCGSKAPL
jgi:hypothetical protein